MKVGMLPKSFLEWKLCLTGGTLPLHGIVKPKPIDEVLMEATIMNVGLMKLR